MYEEIELGERVDKLEVILGQFIVQTNTSLMRLEKEMRGFKDEMRDFKDEMRVFKDGMGDFKDEMRVFKDGMGDFKDEMRVFKDGMGDFKDEMRVFKDEMRVFKDEMSGFKDEMSGFKDEMLEFKNEVHLEGKRMNKQWGELANKMGTLVEDIIAPAVRPVVEKYFKCDILDFYVNARRKNKAMNLSGEFDIIAASEEYAFIVEVKSRPRKQYIIDFKENIGVFEKLFPEYGNKTTVPIFASLRFDEDMISDASREQIYLMAFREWEYMDILNFDLINGQRH